MLLHVPGILSPERVANFRAILNEARWSDGRTTAGHQSVKVKHNLQLPEDDPDARRMGDEIVEALRMNSLFMAAAVPLKVFPPLFNRYEDGGNFGTHVDNAIRTAAGTAHRIRTDLSATLFLSEPDEYDGGELNVEDTYGVHSVKLPAGDLVLYPASSLHHVNAVTRGQRLGAFFWIQSMVRDDGCRTLLFDLDMAVQKLSRDVPDHPSGVQLTGIYHNLLRRWADV